MSTTLYSDKNLPGSPRPKWRALGKDANDVWHNIDAAAGEVVGVHEPSGRVVAREPYDTVDAWVAHVDAEIGWQDHPDATPGRGWLEVVSA
jgi:hypothetical protein